MAIRMCRSTNGVSRKQVEVSRALAETLARQKARGDSHHLRNNGVHAPTWIAPLVRALYEKHVGKDWESKLRAHSLWEKGVAQFRTKSCGRRIHF